MLAIFTVAFSSQCLRSGWLINLRVRRAFLTGLLEGRINFEMDVQVVYRGGPDNQTRIDEATIILSPPVTWPKFEVPVAIFDTERQQPGNFSFDHGYCGLVLEETDGEHGFVAQNDEVAFFFSLDGDKPVHM